MSWDRKRGNYSKVMQIVEQLYQTEPEPKNEKTPESETEKNDNSENEE